MKITTTQYVIALLIFGTISCNSNQQDSAKDAKDSNAVKMDSTGSSTGQTSSIPASVSKDDAQFVVNVANAGMTEIQLGQLAQQKGTAKDVKMYGGMMVKDHTAATDKLKDVAAAKNITLPATVSPEMQKNIDDLGQKSGKDFDKAYISMMVDDHKKVIDMFQSEIKSGSDSTIRDFANNTLPTLQQHLAKAEECKKMQK
jgi:putative membrane protein